MPTLEPRYTPGEVPTALVVAAARPGWSELQARVGEVGHRLYGCDRLGEPVDLATWTMLRSDDGYRTVAVDNVSGGRIVTIWTGLPMDGDIYETAFVPADDRDRIVVLDAYATESSAIQGHRRHVARPPDPT